MYKFGLFFILIVVFFVAAVDLDTATKVNLIAPITNMSNVSGSIVLNATVNDSMSNITNLTFQFTRSGAVIYQTTLFNTSAFNHTTFQNTSFDTSLVGEGLFNITLVAYNTTSNSTGAFITNSSIISIVIDNNAPVIYLNTTTRNTTNATQPLLFMFNDSVYVNATCSALWSGVSYNTSIKNNGTQLTFNPNATIADGSYNVTAVCTDGSLKQGNSTGINITIDTVAPLVTLVSPVDNGNVSGGNNNFNLTITDTTAITSASFRVINNGANISINLTQFGADNRWSTSYNTSLLSEGMHFARIVVNDTMNWTNSTTTFEFMVDYTAPVVTLNTSAQNTTNVTQPIKFVFNDTQFRNASCSALWSGVSYNTSFVNNGTQLTFNPNASIADGSYNVTARCTDGSGNIGTSAGVNISIDTEAPRMTATIGSITQTTATLTVVVEDVGSDVQTCNVTGPVNSALTRSGVTGTWSLGLGSLNQAVTYNANVSCNDWHGFTNSTLVSFTTSTQSSSSSSSSSGGSSSGTSSVGVSTGVAGQFQKEFWASVPAGQSNTLDVTQGDMGVTAVTFALSEKTYGVSLQVKKVDAAPKDAPKIESKVFQVVEITQVNVAKSLQGTAAISFEVPTSWLVANNVDASQVVLLRYHDGKWVELPTVVGDKVGDVVRFTAQTPGFSFFAISGKAGAPVSAASAATTPVSAPVESTAVQPVAQEPVAPASTPSNVAVESESSGFPTWAIVVLVILGLIVVVVLVRSMRSKPETKSYRK